MTDQNSLRWGDYVFGEDLESSADIWEAATSSADQLLLICGAGFDPRTMDVPSALLARQAVQMKVLAIRPGTSGEHDHAEGQAAEHEEALRRLFGDAVHFIDVPAAQDPAAVGTMLTRLLERSHQIVDSGTVVVDISGLPSSISYPLIQLFLLQSRSHTTPAGRFTGDLLVTVSEDASTDARITAVGLEPAGTLSGFRRRPDTPEKLIWIPVLGVGAGEELRAIAALLEPDEICPVVPFPSRDPRQGDNLLVEHRQFLLEDWQFEPRNVLYASETNPFDLYRQIVRLARRYRLALNPLGEPTIVLSEHSSKTLSLGALLAAHEEDMVVAYVRPSAYRLEPSTAHRDFRISTAWLTGYPYMSDVPVTLES